MTALPLLDAWAGSAADKTATGCPTPFHVERVTLVPCLGDAF
jgi:hypothetical protein